MIRRKNRISSSCSGQPSCCFRRAVPALCCVQHRGAAQAPGDTRWAGTRLLRRCWPNCKRAPGSALREASLYRLLGGNGEGEQGRGDHLLGDVLPSGRAPEDPAIAFIGSGLPGGVLLLILVLLAMAALVILVLGLRAAWIPIPHLKKSHRGLRAWPAGLLLIAFLIMPVFVFCNNLTFIRSAQLVKNGGSAPSLRPGFPGSEVFCTEQKKLRR